MMRTDHDDSSCFQASQSTIHYIFINIYVFKSKVKYFFAKFQNGFDINKSFSISGFGTNY